MPRDPNTPTYYDIAAPRASSWTDLPLPWRELLRDPLSVLDLPPAPNFFPTMSYAFRLNALITVGPNGPEYVVHDQSDLAETVSLRDLCVMASTW